MSIGMYVTVKSKPFYLPREFNVVIVPAVCIPLDANARHYYDTISSQQSMYPEAVHIIAGDFNHADLKAVLPKLHHHVKCATRGGKTVKTWPDGPSEKAMKLL